MNINKSIVIILMFSVFETGVSDLFSQSSEKKIMIIELDKRIHVSGYIHILDDSIIAVPANGGLYSVNPPFWILPPDTNFVLLNFQDRKDKRDVFFSKYDFLNDKFFLFWNYPEKDSVYSRKILTIDSCYCYFKHEKQRIFIFGQKGQFFSVFTYENEQLKEILTLKYFPSAVQIMDSNTLVLSFLNKLILVNKEDGAKELVNIENYGNINGFVMTDDYKLFISTDLGVFQFLNNNMIRLTDKVSGSLYTYGENLYILNAKKNQIGIISL